MKRDNLYTLQRFALKIALFALFASAQGAAGFASALSIMAAIAAVIDVLIVLYRREPLRFGHLGYWDEAAGFVLLSGLLIVVSRA